MISHEQFLSLLGTQPDNVELDIQILDETDCGSYKRTLIEYTTEPDERINAFLLVPHNINKQAPGILAIHQDGAHRPYEFGKSETAGVAGDPELAYGKELAERGYVVISPDRFPFESRMLAKSRYVKTFDLFKVFVRDGDRETDLTEDLYAGCVANKLIFEGRTLLGKTLYELKRAIDLLCSLPYVDSNRIGVIGHSAGGFYSSLLMFIDNRIKAGCSSCGTFLIGDIYSEDNLRPINGFGSALAVPGFKQLGDIDDILAALAPRPFMESTGDVGEDQGWFNKVHSKAVVHYQSLGISERYQTHVYDGGHVFRTDMREKSYQWFDRWLNEIADYVR